MAVTHRRFPGPRLCPVCGFAMDPVLADVDDHPNCGADPGAVPRWRRRHAQRLTPDQLAGYVEPLPAPDEPQEP